MEKPNRLRAHLLDAVPQLKKNPDRLLIFIESGSLTTTLAPGLSYEQSYSLTIVLTDFAGSPDAVFIPLLAWLRVNQSELLTNPTKYKDALKFEAEIIDQNKVDFSLTLPLTERTIVKPQPDGSLAVSYPDEPAYTSHLPETPVQVYAGTTLLAEWTSAAPVGVDIETPNPGRIHGR